MPGYQNHLKQGQRPQYQQKPIPSHLKPPQQRNPNFPQQTNTGSKPEDDEFIKNQFQRLQQKIADDKREAEEKKLRGMIAMQRPSHINNQVNSQYNAMQQQAAQGARGKKRQQPQMKPLDKKKQKLDEMKSQKYMNEQ